MVDTVEMQDIRGLDIEKTVRGFSLTEYIFKNDCLVSAMSGDSVRWYQETAADLTITAPSYIQDVSRLAAFPTVEVSWTRNTSYVKKYAAEDFISMEDIKGADIDVVARTLLRLTRAVTKQVDNDIWNVMTQNQTPATINTVACNAPWNIASWTGVDIIEDLMDAKMQISNYGYNPEGASLYLSPTDYKSMVTWLISSKGSSIPAFASDKVSSGTVMQILGLNVKVSLNVTTSGAAVVIPNTACTWKEHTAITSKAIEDVGLGTKFRVYELGIAILTDPRAVTYITGTQIQP
jgi:hypothetical protein